VGCGVGVCLGVKLAGREQKRVLVTATHVVEAGLYFKGTHPTNTVKLDNKDIKWTYNGDCAIGEVPTSVWTLLAVRCAPVATLYRGDRLHISAPTEKVGMSERADGSALLPLPSVMYPWAFTHSCSTRPGLSGSAIRNVYDAVIGVHVGAVPGEQANLGICLLPVLEHSGFAAVLGDRVHQEDSKDTGKEPFYEKVDRLMRQGYNRQAATARAEDEESQAYHDEQDWEWSHRLSQEEEYYENHIGTDPDGRDIYANNRGQYSHEPSDDTIRADDIQDVDDDQEDIRHEGAFVHLRPPLTPAQPSPATVAPVPSVSAQPCAAPQARVKTQRVPRPGLRILKRGETLSSTVAPEVSLVASPTVDPCFPAAAHHPAATENVVDLVTTQSQPAPAPPSPGHPSGSSPVTTTSPPPTSEVGRVPRQPSSKKAARKPQKQSTPSVQSRELLELIAQSRRTQSLISRLSQSIPSSKTGRGR